MICYLRTSAGGFDIRLKKYIQACEYSKTPYMAVTWDRLANAELMPHEISFHHKAPYGYGHRLKNFILLLWWYLFALKTLIIHHKKYKVIHACNIETMPVAYFFKLFFKKKVIFDIYDTSGKAKLERFFILRSDILILPHKKRLEQELTKENEFNKLVVVENVPVFNNNRQTHNGLKDINKIVLSYVGTFQREIRGLENVLSFVLSDNRFVLEIAGSGDGFDQELQKAAKDCNRIHFYGAVNYSKALDIMQNSDFILAQYYLNAPTHEYASPNKYYESLFLGVPIITTHKTLVGHQVEECNSGYVIGENLEDLIILFSNIDEKFIENYHKKEKAAQEKWESDYSDYLENHMINQYIHECKKVANEFNRE